MPGRAALRVFRFGKEVDAILDEYNVTRAAVFNRYGSSVEPGASVWTNPDADKHIAALQEIDVMLAEQFEIRAEPPSFADLEAAAIPPGALSDLAWWLDL
jgi:hypothetical protein